MKFYAQPSFGHFTVLYLSDESAHANRWVAYQKLITTDFRLRQWIASHRSMSSRPVLI